jgi:hypothetical protein
MPLYHLLLDAEQFCRLRPALAESWRRRSFDPCRPLCEELLPAAQAFHARYHLGSEQELVARVAEGLPFDRDFWRHLAGEVLWLSAAEIPEMQTTPEALCCLQGADLTLDPGLERERLAPIQQAYFGTRDLTFGTAFYRPGQAGYNDVQDVGRLDEYLAAVDPARWDADALARLPGLEDEAERAEELELVKDWFPALQELYRRARRQGQVVVCETL